MMRLKTFKHLVLIGTAVFMSFWGSAWGQIIYEPPFVTISPCGTTVLGPGFPPIDAPEPPPDPDKCPWDVTAWGWCPYYEPGCHIEIDVDTMMIYPNGPATDRYDIVFIGDGFVGDFMFSGFNERVTEAINAIKTMEPYASYECAFNFYQAEIVSNQTGADYQWTHGGEHTFECKDTELNMSFGHRQDLSNPDDDDPHYRLVTPTHERCFDAACLNGYTNYDMVIVLVNDDKFGGSAWDEGVVPMLFVSVGENFETTITHELAHVIAGLGDEYQCGECDCDGNPVGDGSLVPYLDTAPIDFINVSTGTTVEELPWGNMVNVDVSSPTDPAQGYVDIDTGILITIENVIGRFEGADGYNTNVFRPQLNCHMRCLSDPVTDEPMPFCVVCSFALSAALESHCSLVLDVPLEVSDRFSGDAEYYWSSRKGFRWPMPKWSGMYDKGVDSVTVEIVTNSMDAELVILDKGSEIVARAGLPGGLLRAWFEAKPFEEYFIQLTTGSPSSETLTVSAKLFINAVEVTLD